jgi:acetyl-CoA synthetase
MVDNKKEILMLDQHANLKDYEQTCQSMDWQEVQQSFTWSRTGRVNIVHEAIDRHVDEGRGNQTALLFTDQETTLLYTFSDLSKLSSKFARGLKSLGIDKGDRVFMFMPRCPEIYIAILGTVRIGAIAGPLFEAFMEEAVKDRLADSGAVAIVTTSDLLSRIPMEKLPDLKHVIVLDDHDINKTSGTISFTELLNLNQSEETYMTWVDREDGMILHYTSGSTGKPKGVLQDHDAMIHQYLTGKWVCDFRPGDIYWCTADPGWVTGTSLGMWSPWLNGITVVMRGGRFNPVDWYTTLEKFKVTVWSTAPTALRMLMAAGDELLKDFKLSSLRHIISQGEALNPEVIRWGIENLGVRIHDNWWMTEAGSSICSNFRSLPIRPGSMGKPFPGIEVAILDNQGNKQLPYSMGNLAVRPPWPGMMRQIWNNPEKYQEYFKNGWYISGDTAYMDESGYYWYQGRIDDVINTSGERVGPFEVENKLVEHPAVAEAGVIGIPDPARGEIVKAFISLRDGYVPSEELKSEIATFIRKGLAAHAAPRQIEFKEKLPKTRSGKIMRRLLKAWELGLPTGDLSTMED